MSEKSFSLNCPVPVSVQDRITLAHGGGGQKTHDLITELFSQHFGNQIAAQTDSALLTYKGQQLAFSVDSYVVQPLVFPGGNIGDLAVCGTINDLAMVGAKPLWMSAAFILEEGMELKLLETIVMSMQKVASASGVKIVTGDTKVIEQGRGDGVYISTSGIGVIEHKLTITPESIQHGDVIIISNDIGRHGMSIMATREGLEFDTTIVSDTGALWKPVQALLNEGIELHCMRDLTRGGLFTALIELAESANKTFNINAPDIPIHPEVQGACEILGLEPGYVANEGCFVILLPAAQAEQALEILKTFAQCSLACIIGQVSQIEQKQVLLRNAIGTERALRRQSGEQLPRIC